MKIEHIALEALIPYARNSRTHSEAQGGEVPTRTLHYPACEVSQ